MVGFYILGRTIGAVQAAWSSAFSRVVVVVIVMM
jgi:hypothetical protein